MTCFFLWITDTTTIPLSKKMVSQIDVLPKLELPSYRGFLGCIARLLGVLPMETHDLFQRFVSRLRQPLFFVFLPLLKEPFP